MTTRTRSRGYAKFGAQDANENTSPLPALAKVTTKEDCERMTPTDALLHFKTRVYHLVNKLRVYKNEKGCDRTLPDWWFPLISQENQMVKNWIGSNKHKSSSFSKTMCPSFASNLGLTITEFNILKNKTKGMWRKEKQLGFPVQFTKDQGVEWILLDEHHSINEHLPFHQTTGKRKAPSWIESCDLDYESVSYSLKSKSESKRKFESEVEYENETDDDDDEELDDDLPNPVRLGRPTGSRDQYINLECQPNAAHQVLQKNLQHMRLRLLKRFVLVWSVEVGSSKHVFIEMILEHLWWGKFVEGSIINGRRQSSNSVLL